MMAISFIKRDSVDHISENKATSIIVTHIASGKLEMSIILFPCLHGFITVSPLLSGPLPGRRCRR